VIHGNKIPPFQATRSLSLFPFLKDERVALGCLPKCTFSPSDIKCLSLLPKNFSLLLHFRYPSYIYMASYDYEVYCAFGTVLSLSQFLLNFNLYRCNNSLFRLCLLLLLLSIRKSEKKSVFCTLHSNMKAQQCCQHVPGPHPPTADSVHRPDDRASTFLWNVGLLQRNYTAQYPTRLSFRPCTVCFTTYVVCNVTKGKGVPQHTYEGAGGRGCITRTHY
jgi:hypothetical protein